MFPHLMSATLIDCILVRLNTFTLKTSLRYCVTSWCVPSPPHQSEGGLNQASPEGGTLASPTAAPHRVGRPGRKRKQLPVSKPPPARGKQRFPAPCTHTRDGIQTVSQLFTHTHKHTRFYNNVVAD